MFRLAARLCRRLDAITFAGNAYGTRYPPKNEAAALPPLIRNNRSTLRRTPYTKSVDVIAALAECPLLETINAQFIQDQPLPQEVNAVMKRLIKQCPNVQQALLIGFDDDVVTAALKSGNRIDFVLPLAPICSCL